MFNKIKSRQLQNTTVLFLLSAPFIVVSYCIYVFNPYHADNFYLYILLLIADSIGIFSLLGLWLTILLDVVVPSHHYDHSEYNIEFLTKGRSLDIYVTYAGEPIEVIRKTLIAAKNLEYKHETFLLDDSKSDEAKILAAELGVHYIRRAYNHFAKAGNINHGLQYGKGEFFAVLDADQSPRKNFIVSLLGYLHDSQIAMVQAPQHFTNVNKFIAAGTSQAQEIFYKYICPARNLSNSVFCVGTNVIFRRSAIDQIGGIAKLSHSEDLWTSRKLHELGWKTVFVNEVLTDGTAPDTIISYMKQQLRWAKGGLSMLFHDNPLLSKNLTLDQKLQYFFTNTFYFVGISTFAYILFPILYLLYDIKPLETGSGSIWLLHYIPYLLMYYGLTWLLLGKMHIATISVSLASFYPYLMAIGSTLFGTEQEWIATASRKKKSEPLLKWLWPHILLISLSIMGLFVGWYDPADFWVTFFYSILALWNVYLLLIYITGENRFSKISV